MIVSAICPRSARRQHTEISVIKLQALLDRDTTSSFSLSTDGSKVDANKKARLINFMSTRQGCEKRLLSPDLLSLTTSSGKMGYYSSPDAFEAEYRDDSAKGEGGGKKRGSWAEGDLGFKEREGWFEVMKQKRARREEKGLFSSERLIGKTRNGNLTRHDCFLFRLLTLADTLCFALSSLFDPLLLDLKTPRSTPRRASPLLLPLSTLLCFSTTPPNLDSSTTKALLTGQHRPRKSEARKTSFQE